MEQHGGQRPAYRRRRHHWGCHLRHRYRADNIQLNAHPSFTVVSDGGNSATQVKTDRTESNNDNWINSLAVVRTGVLKGQVVKVSDYDGTTKILTFESPGLTATPANGVTFSILNQ